MSSIAHMLGQNDQLAKTDSRDKSSDTSQINEIPKITTTSPPITNNNRNIDPKTTREEPELEKQKSTSTSSDTSSTTVPTVRKSVDLTAEQQVVGNGGVNSNNTEAQDSSNNNQIHHQRKRSKVSRACDDCRRKKIRCDATFSSTSNSVMKPCTTCLKNNSTCSFDRVPLKRGPTKGYTKPDGESTRERSKSSTSRRSSSMSNHPALQQVPQQTNPQLRPNSSSPITLPPLISLTNNVPLKSYGNSNNSSAPRSSSNGNNSLDVSNSISQPTSPRRGSTFSQGGGDQPLNSQSLSISQQQQQQQQATNNGPIPQGLFWKVPYSQGPFDRRGSVDSVSSSFSDSRSSRFSSNSIPGSGINPNTSNSNFLFGARPSVNYESSVISDSEDDRVSNYSPRASIDASRANRSRSNSFNVPPQPTSPAMSISSLHSLNQGFNKNMILQNSNVALAQQQQHQMVEIYYQLIHPSFPILPLNKQSLGNLLAIPSSKNQEIQEINNLIVHSFYSSLDGLIISASRGARSPSIISMQQVNSDQTTSLNPLQIIATNFTNLIRVFPQLQSKFNLYSQNIVILFTSSIVLLSYSIALLGFESDIYISSSVAVFNKLKIFRLFWDKSHQVTADNYDDYNSILKRLYVSLDIVDTLQSLSFGIPKLISIDYDPSIVDILFPSFNDSASVNGLDFEMAKRNMKFGLILTKISSSRKFAELTYSSTFLSDLKTKYNYFSNIIEESPVTHHDQISVNFLDLIIAKFELVGFLDEVCQNIIGQPRLDEELIYDFQLKCLRIVKKQLELQSNLLKSIKNYSNSIDNNQLVSPFLPLAFRQSIKALNIQKILINSLQFNKDLIGRLSKPLNDLISLNNYLSLLKPFKAEELNNHINFSFVSEHLKYLELYNESSTSSNINKETEILKHWVGLINDVKSFIQKEDYDGWF
ncbi:hypothetical protein BN7_6301 [Wickerhamomyces ciferrii]|uniref:Zn(2)-C6 fungal-type domain-containing protein n=1 Tax=Wickerhamomyces ciferrii (strain ATCC 14091 / BCRC 22168 / CBS 111 / JCM 3599 / NBRC 0793 / NRRL Y-1031 F-60-10) TaxID=1206466 RepID=K0KZD2_WICCF|nr:uncharacterized protein BN7_6301 [Wickerhamomyces ciferrii]CCH46704.1 hypothetical protein BN7_6301 [Wickerhamomyces ciferrii]